MPPRDNKIDFIERHQPALESGEYRVRVEQTVEVKGEDLFNQASRPQAAKTFYVAGERFHLLPEHIKSVFPPAHSLGEHSHVLPHIMLSRTTLPWERETSAGDRQTPWLALLVIHEDEAADTETAVVKLSDLKTASASAPYFQGVVLESGQKDDDKVAIVDIKKSLLEKMFPAQKTKETLRFLTHLRQERDEVQDKVVGEDAAVVIANRLPQRGAVNTVYLVSLENRFTRGEDGSFDYQGAGPDDKIRLVQLYSWQFTSTEHFKVTATFLTKASDLPAEVKNKLLAVTNEEFFTREAFVDRLGSVLTTTELNRHQAAILNDFAYGNFAAILKHLDRKTATLRLTDTGEAVADQYLQMGFTPLAHKLRRGARTVSWYHGPLSPKSNAEEMDFPVKSSDQMLRYYENNGMLDVSYAAAWELGRLLALQNTHFSTELYQWKRRYAKSQNKSAQQGEHQTGHLQSANQDNTPEPLPASVGDWLGDLGLLKGVPFNYLVPDEELLPVESIRFFQLDQLWIRSLLDGAFSVGRVTGRDYRLDVEIATEEQALLPGEISGFILRSEVVSGWPGMFIEGYDDGDTANELDLIRREKLSENILLCLFAGELKILDLHLKPEVLHFGVNQDSDSPEGYSKELRDEQGRESPNYKIAVPLDSNRVLDLESLLDRIQNKYGEYRQIAWSPSPTSANLALQLLEGVEQVRFIRTPT